MSRYVSVSLMVLSRKKILLKKILVMLIYQVNWNDDWSPLSHFFNNLYILKLKRLDDELVTKVVLGFGVGNDIYCRFIQRQWRNIASSFLSKWCYSIKCRSFSSRTFIGCTKKPLSSGECGSGQFHVTYLVTSFIRTK